MFKGGKSGNTRKALGCDELDEVLNNHVFSLEDNFEKFEQVIIRRMEERYIEVENRQKKQKVIIDKLKEKQNSREGNHGAQRRTDKGA